MIKKVLVSLETMIITSFLKIGGLISFGNADNQNMYDYETSEFKK